MCANVSELQEIANRIAFTEDGLRGIVMLMDHCTTTSADPALLARAIEPLVEQLSVQQESINDFIRRIGRAQRADESR